VELTAAVVMLVGAMAVTVQLLGWLVAERRATERHERATQEAANALERLVARPWDALTPGDVKGVELPGPARDVLPGGALRAAVAEEAGPPALKRVAVEVRWLGRSGRAEAPVRLTAWVARAGRPSR
jgi:hypothetical protein